MTREELTFGAQRYAGHRLTLVPFEDRILVGTGFNPPEFIASMTPEELFNYIANAPPRGAPAPIPTLETFSFNLELDI